MRHHTKDKGDIGTAYVIANLLEQGIHSCLPLSEHLPFDLIGIREDGKVYRISVKYREVKKGAITVSLSSSYSDSNGVHTKAIDKSLIDLIAIYCPDTRKVYYVDHTKFNKHITLRVEKPKNNQTANVHLADDYLIVP